MENFQPHFFILANPVYGPICYHKAMKQFTHPYFNAIASLLTELDGAEAPYIETASQWTAQTLCQGNIIHTFGCGHSLSPALEPFHRSGCFAAVNVILAPELQFMHGAATGTRLERQEGYSPRILAQHNLQKGDILFVFSNSGRNPAGIDAVLYAKEKGVKTVSVSAKHAHQKSRSRHSGGLMLFDVADLALDNHCAANETCLELDGLQLAPLSTVAACAVFHAVLFRAAQILAEQGVKLPVYQSSNLPGNDETNERLSQLYKNRIKHL